MSQSNNTALSRTLTKILRHKASDYGLNMSSDGYVLLTDLLCVPALKKLNANKEVIDSIVANCPKQRFAFNDDHTAIKANQGHTIETLDDEKMMIPITLENCHEYPSCVHGTYRKAWKLIEESGGLSRMQRRHIHFSSEEFGSKQMISGMRSNAQVLISIDLKKALENGYKFYVSLNKVILTRGDENTGLLPNTYFSKVKFL